MDKLKYLVLDEADRMVEATHYQDMWNILGASSSLVEGGHRHLVYSATLMVSKRMMEQPRKKAKAVSRQHLMAQLLVRVCCCCCCCCVVVLLLVW